ncbi:hypothetical protein BAE44_0020771 [Dichanthelium oligosanthes]|uniref:Uncharacterized protein n=1 Tax=Dichanthelium oligosanthes TaxID=888268 RepID=A0A1E5UZ95_9POAL|nr:hypothetical protein BAE44_0020771 [Dichanthelium oligosanthes]
MFVEADADVRLAELEAAGLMPPFPCADQLLFDVEGSSGVLNCPLLLIQAPTAPLPPSAGPQPHRSSPSLHRRPARRSGSRPSPRRPRTRRSRASPTPAAPPSPLRAPAGDVAVVGLPVLPSPVEDDAAAPPSDAEPTIPSSPSPPNPDALEPNSAFSPFGYAPAVAAQSPALPPARVAAMAWALPVVLLLAMWSVQWSWRPQLLPLPLPAPVAGQGAGRPATAAAPTRQDRPAAARHQQGGS